jgi:hypothetical protein
VAPLFFLLLLVIIEGGRFVLYYQTLNNAVRDGSRYAIVHGSRSFCPSGPMPPDEGISCDEGGANVVDRVESGAFGLLSGGSLTVTPTWPDGSNGRDSVATVHAAYEYRTVIPLLPIPPLTVEAESSLVINN